MKRTPTEIARSTLCFDCPPEIKAECQKLNNGGASCEKLFENYYNSKTKKKKD